MTTTTTSNFFFRIFRNIRFDFSSLRIFFDRSFFSTSSFEKILQRKNKTKKSSFTHLIIELFFERIEKSRVNYVKMRKILQLIAKIFHNDDDNSIKNLSLKLNNLKKHVRRHIFMLKLLRKILSIVIKKQSFLTIKKKSAKKTVQTTYRLFLTSSSKRTTLRSLFDLTFDIICI